MDTTVSNKASTSGKPAIQEEFPKTRGRPEVLSDSVGCRKYKQISFINIMYSFLTTDYKEDQIQLPEILNRIRNLGLEP